MAEHQIKVLHKDLHQTDITFIANHLLQFSADFKQDILDNDIVFYSRVDIDFSKMRDNGFVETMAEHWYYFEFKSKNDMVWFKTKWL